MSKARGHQAIRQIPDNADLLAIFTGAVGADRDLGAIGDNALPMTCASASMSGTVSDDGELEAAAAAMHSLFGPPDRNKK